MRFEKKVKTCTTEGMFTSMQMAEDLEIPVEFKEI